MEAAAVLPVQSALSLVAEDARSRSYDGSGAEAYKVWDERVAAAGADLPREVFAAETGFSALARLALEDRLASAAPRFTNAFPHLYGSTSFAWYELPSDLRARVLAELSAHRSEEPGELLGWLYQFAIPLEVRRQFGQFYTGPSIVRSMLDSLGYTGPRILGKRLLDPASGAGAYLTEAARRVIAAAAEEKLSAEETCLAVQESIHGMDLNAMGVLLSEAALALLLVQHLRDTDESFQLAPLRLFVTDTLRQGDFDFEADSTEVVELKARSGRYEDGFHFVVANPPYSKFPTRLMDSEQKRRFEKTMYGHPNLYGLFLQVGTELLADGGRLAYINPKSFVSGLYFRNLRRFLKEQLDIQRLDTFGKRTGLFDGVLQEVVIVTAERSDRQSDEMELREYAGAPDKRAARVTRVPAGSVLLPEEFDHAFFVTADPLAHRVLEAMMRDSKPLRALGYEAITGTIVWNRVKPHIRDEASADALPLIWSKGIRGFYFDGLGNRDGKSTHCALVKKTENIVSKGDALLVKRLTAREEPRRIVACRVPSDLAASARGYFGENHINIVRPRGDAAEIELDAVLGLLNSRLFDFVFRALNGNTQVSATELEMLPVPLGAELPAIAEQARKLSDTNGNDEAALRELNRLVYLLYGISSKDAEAVGYGS